MKTKYTISGFFLAVLVFAGFAACENPIMKEWWDDSSGKINQGDAPSHPGVVYTVHFDMSLDSIPNTRADQLENQPGDQLVAAGGKIREPERETGTIPGYGFAGWYVDIDKNEIIDDADTKWGFSLPLSESSFIINGVMTLYAKWVDSTVTPSWTVKFDSNGGTTTPRDQVVVDGCFLVEPSAGRKANYGFAGWYRGQTFSEAERWNFDNSVVTNNITLYAKWGPPNSVVMFDAEGGLPVPDYQELANGQTIWEPEIMTRVGYGFGGWYANQLCAGEPWDFSTPVTQTAVILYAKWVPNLYTVTFEVNGGSPAPATQRVANGSHVERPAIMTKTGEGFGGWYTDPNFSPESEWNFLTGTVTGNTPLYAKWETGVYKVIFDSAGGTSVPEQSVVYNYKATRPPDPTKSAYAFKGWYASPDPSNRFLFDFDTQIASDTTLYARWVKHNPVIVYVPGGTFSMGGLGGSGATTRPAHTVTVSGFYIYPVETIQAQIDLITWWKKRTNGGEFTADMKDYDFWSPDSTKHGFNPSAAKGEYRPIESITWYDAVYLCNLATEYENKITRSGLKQFELPYTITNIVHGDPDGDGPLAAPLATGADLEIPDYCTFKERNNAYAYTSIISATVTLNEKLNPKSPSYAPEDVGYRLPTEAEWEYAARGGHGSPGDYLWAGSNTSNDVAWYGGGSGNTTQTQIPKGKAPNNLGLYDMSGNVCEWVWDAYDKDYYKQDAFPDDNSIDPLGPSGASGPSSNMEERARRGGSIRHSADNCRSQVRDSWPAAKTDNWNIGFRIVRSGEE